MSNTVTFIIILVVAVIAFFGGYLVGNSRSSTVLDSESASESVQEGAVVNPFQDVEDDNEDIFEDIKTNPFE